MADSRRRTNRAEGERLRSDAHDLKAPLGNIINVSQFLMEEELERADQLEFLAVIRENARTMQRAVAG